MDYDRLRELQEKFEENPRRYFAPLANEYRKGGQPKRAIDICRAQLAEMPGHMSGQIVFGQALYEAGEFDEARQVFERALTLDPENLIALRTLGDMSLQRGDTAQARKWYTHLLEADPKDSAVIALVTEIDASAEAVTPAPEVIPGVDTDAGDQPIPFITDNAGVAIGPEPPVQVASAATPEVESFAPAPPPPPPPPPPSAAPTAPPPEIRASEAQAPGAHATEAHATDVHAPPLGATIGRTTVPAPPTSTGSSGPASVPPEGLERHYPVEQHPVKRHPVEQQERPHAAGAPAAGVDDDYEIPLGAEGLHSAVAPPSSGLEGVQGSVVPIQSGAEDLRAAGPREQEPEGAEGLQGKPVVSPLEGARTSRTDDEDALEAWTPPPGAHVHERVESRKEDRMFSGAAPEPFVNETMAQLYLQQGYRQLALKVYYQLAAARPNDQALKDRIAEIEAADRAAHSGGPEFGLPTATAAPGETASRASHPAPRVPPAARQPEPSIERPTPPPPAPRSPSIEAPTPAGAPESEERPSFDRSPIDSPPASQPSRERESIETPTPDERRAEPEGIAARQPSIREFFATLGRRRPPRTAAATGRSGSGGYGGKTGTGSAAAIGASQSDSIDAGNAGAGKAPGSAVPGASLDAVFAGAQVNPADSRAASRLAGAFSAVPGASRTPPTPPMPTPRVNPRVPQAQESEEDVAKFRAWLDGLTGE